MKYDIEKISNEYGYIKDNLEKVIRLNDILNIIYTTEYKDKLVLKGGTCINLFYRDMPRLSVDIDLDYIGSIKKDKMLEDKKVISEFLVKILENEGYFLSTEKTKRYYALDSLVFRYTNTSGNNDNIKIEINYMDRLHLYPVEKKKCQNKILKENTNIIILSETEVYATKIVALLNRATPRDLFDVIEMIKNSSKLNVDKDTLRKAIVFYNCISGESNLLDNKIYEKINGITKNEVFRHLLPMLMKDEKIDLEKEKDIVIDKLKKILKYTKEEKEFITEFYNRKVLAEKLYKDEKMQKIVSNHPMVEFRLRNMGDELTMYWFNKEKQEIERMTKELFNKVFLKNDTKKGNKIWNELKKEVKASSLICSGSKYVVRTDGNDWCVYGINLNKEIAKEIYEEE